MDDVGAETASPTIAAEVTVPDVSRIRRFSARSRSISAAAASTSPTLAPWIQTSGPERADIGADAAPFADPRRVLLAELQPPLDQRRRQRHHRGRQFPVDAQRHR